MSGLQIPQREPCPFCSCLQQTEECTLIFRDDKVASIVDRYPVERGHIFW